MIIYALRGLVYFEISIKVGDHDMHSGVYGNAVSNPAQILADLFVPMKDITTGEVLIPGFYDDVRKIEKKELDVLQNHIIANNDFQKDAGAYGLTSMREVPPYLAPKIFPSLDIHGIQSGFLGEGPKTIIPAEARAKFSCRQILLPTTLNLINSYPHQHFLSKRTRMIILFTVQLTIHLSKKQPKS